jgi:hypothetical protein
LVNMGYWKTHHCEKIFKMGMSDQLVQLLIIICFFTEEI